MGPRRLVFTTVGLMLCSISGYSQASTAAKARVYTLNPLTMPRVNIVCLRKSSRP